MNPELSLSFLIGKMVVIIQTPIDSFGKKPKIIGMEDILVEIQKDNWVLNINI